MFFLNFYKVEAIGLLHNTKKLNKSFTQKIIGIKIKKYFVLSDHLKNKAIVKKSKTKIESYYPIFFPKFKKINLSKEGVWLCIPGRVTYERRDYDFLIEKLSDNSIYNKTIKFIILGNINTPDGIKFKKKIETLGFDNSFVFFDGFISNDLYYSYLKISDFILPLLKKEDSSYLTQKISGTFNLAFGFKKQLLCNEYFSSIPDLSENSIFYKDSNFNHLINNIDETEKKKIYTSKKWSYEYQYSNFIDFIES